MRTTILVPLDGSFESESALHHAAAMAPDLNARLELLHCFEPPVEVDCPFGLSHLSAEVLESMRGEEEMRSYLKTKARELDPVPCDPRLEVGDPTALILARAEQADLVVISRYGRRGLREWSAESMANKVARSCSKPVMVVTNPHARPKLERILVCLDGSRLSPTVLATAAHLARAVGAKLVLYRFVPRLRGSLTRGKAIEDAQADLRELGRAYADLVAEVAVHQAEEKNPIERGASELNADLVVVGSQGHRGLARWVLGSVAEDALANARCPIMIVPRDLVEEQAGETHHPPPQSP